MQLNMKNAITQKIFKNFLGTEKKEIMMATTLESLKQKQVCMIIRIYC